MVAMLSLGTSGAYAIDTSSITPPGNVMHFESAPTCKIDCVDPHPACEESAKVIETLKTIYEAFGRGDVAGCGKYIDDNCTTFDEATKSLIVGKKAVLEDIQKKIEQFRDDRESPLVSYTIERPYAAVKGDTAVVTFIAYKTFAGKHPRTLRSHCTDIFVKKDGQWLKMHYRSDWKPVG
jgi:hypothetical protein